MVEAPGTAPGSEWLITKAIYRHSQLAPARIYIGLSGGKKKIIAATTPRRESKRVYVGRQELVALEFDDLARSGLDLHLDLVPARIIALDLPETVIELDHLDLHDPLVEGHLADILDGQGPGESGLGERKAQSGEDEGDAH